MAIKRNPGIWNPETRTYTPGPEEVTHEGRVLQVYQRDHQAMSDVYTLATFALVFCDDGGAEEVLVNANFECDVSFGRAQADASPEMRLAHECWKEGRRLEQERRESEARRLRAEKEALTPKRGSRVVGAKGKNRGLVGTVAFVSGSRALVKDDACWEDRQADGTWVLLSSLALRPAA